MAECVQGRSEEKNLRNEWKRASQRLDSIFMIIFLALNSILTIALLIIGYSNLQVAREWSWTH